MVSSLYVFDQCVPFIFHFSQLSGIFIVQKQHTCLQKLFFMPKNSSKEYFVEQKNKSNQQQLITTNFECLVAKHDMFAPN